MHLFPLRRVRSCLSTLNSNPLHAALSTLKRDRYMQPRVSFRYFVDMKQLQKKYMQERLRRNSWLVGAWLCFRLWRRHQPVHWHHKLPGRGLLHEGCIGKYTGPRLCQQRLPEHGTCMVLSVARYRFGMVFDFPYCLKGLGAAKIGSYRWAF